MAEFSEDFDTEKLIDFLDSFKIFGFRVLRVLEDAKIDGHTFLQLTDGKLLKLGMKEEEDRKAILKKISELKKGFDQEVYLI